MDINQAAILAHRIIVDYTTDSHNRLHYVKYLELGGFCKPMCDILLLGTFSNVCKS